MAVLLFDYRGFGDSGGVPRQLVSIHKQLEDWDTALDFARAQPEVDSSQVVTWGFSLGAGHALTVAARDEAVAAVVAVAPELDCEHMEIALEPHRGRIVQLTLGFLSQRLLSR